VAWRPVTEGPPSAEPPAEPGSRGPSAPTLGDLFFIGTACAISIVGAGGIGYLLDSWLGTLPWLTFAGLAFGITSAVMLTYANLRKYL
jgi:hypothetical protein